jgi:hypothetical protein
VSSNFAGRAGSLQNWAFPKPAVFYARGGDERARPYAFEAHDANLFCVDFDALGERCRV